MDVYRSVICCIKSVIANQCAHWCGNPFSFGTTVKQMFLELLEEPKTPLSKGVGSPFRRSGGIRAGSTNSPKTLQNNGVAACGIPPSRLFKATHLPLTREALGEADSSINIYLTYFNSIGAADTSVIHYSLLVISS